MGRVFESITYLHGAGAAKQDQRYVPFSVIYVRHGPGSYSLGRASGSVSTSVPVNTPLATTCEVTSGRIPFRPCGCYFSRITGAEFLQGSVGRPVRAKEQGESGMSTSKVHLKGIRLHQGTIQPELIRKPLAHHKV